MLPNSPSECYECALTSEKALIIFSAEGLLKDDLVELLQEHLDTNDAKYARNPLFSEYYGRSSSPLKRERVTPPGSVVMKTRRRQTLRVQDS
jgi:hypothetical protein